MRSGHVLTFRGLCTLGVMEKEVEDVALIKDVYTYLASKVYPDDCPGNRKRVIRKKALKFLISENGELFYRHKQKGKVGRSVYIMGCSN